MGAEQEVQGMGDSFPTPRENQSPIPHSQIVASPTILIPIPIPIPTSLLQSKRRYWFQIRIPIP